MHIKNSKPNWSAFFKVILKIGFGLILLLSGVIVTAYAKADINIYAVITGCFLFIFGLRVMLNQILEAEKNVISYKINRNN